MSMPTWEDFKKKHILNPGNHPGYESWNKLDQNTWLRNRLAGFSANPRQAYGRKSVNSVVIATSQEILDDFHRPGVQYKSHTIKNYYWSNRQYPMWLFRKSNEGEDYSITKLHQKYGPMHFVAKINPPDHKPIHFSNQDTIPSDSPHKY